MPAEVLRSFIYLAILFSIYSITCYLMHPKNWKRYLAIIAVANFAYSIYTVYQVIRYRDELTMLGYVYFIVEIIIILALSLYELKLATKIA